MKRFEVNVSELEKVISNGTGISLVSKPIGIRVIEKRFGKYRDADNKKIIKAVTDENIESIRVGDLYFHSNELRKR